MLTDIPDDKVFAHTHAIHDIKTTCDRISQKLDEFLDEYDETESYPSEHFVIAAFCSTMIGVLLGYFLRMYTTQC